MSFFDAVGRRWRGRVTVRGGGPSIHSISFPFRKTRIFGEASNGDSQVVSAAPTAVRRACRIQRRALADARIRLRPFHAFVSQVHAHTLAREEAWLAVGVRRRRSVGATRSGRITLTASPRPTSRARASRFATTTLNASMATVRCVRCLPCAFEPLADLQRARSRFPRAANVVLREMSSYRLDTAYACARCAMLFPPATCCADCPRKRHAGGASAAHRRRPAGAFESRGGSEQRQAAGQAVLVRPSQAARVT